MSHTTAPPFVRLRASLAVTSAKRLRGIKRLAGDLDTDKDTRATRARAWRPCSLSKKPDASAAPAIPPTLSPPAVSPPPIIDLEEGHRDEQLPSPWPSPPLGGLGSDLGSIVLGGEISADATRAMLSPKSSYESLARSPSPVKGSVVPIPKRRVDWERDDDENPSDAVRHANPAKKLRTCEPSPNLHSGTKDMPDIPCLLLGGESLSAASLDLLHPSEDDRMPAPMMTAQELGTCQSSADSEHDSSSSDGFASPSPLSRWQAPRSSPLGPRTSPYCRRSKISPFPSILSSSFVKDHLVRNVVNDNVARDPSEQSAQWCEDLHALGVNETFHPKYICRHEYHPSDPEYDEEWSNETWSDEEWSDSEDTLPSPADEDQAESSVTIIRAEEQPQANNSETFTFVHWNNWRPSLPLPPHVLDIHPPLGSPWNASEGVGKEAKERRGDVFADTAELFPTA